MTHRVVMLVEYQLAGGEQVLGRIKHFYGINVLVIHSHSFSYSQTSQASFLAHLLVLDTTSRWVPDSIPCCELKSQRYSFALPMDSN